MVRRDAIPISRRRRFREAAAGTLLTVGLLWILQSPVDDLSGKSRILVDTLGPDGFHVLLWAGAVVAAALAMVSLMRGLRSK